MKFLNKKEVFQIFLTKNNFLKIVKKFKCLKHLTYKINKFSRKNIFLNFE